MRTYDPTGQRSEKAVDGGPVTEYLYSGASVIAEYDGTGTLLRRYVPGAWVDERIAMIEDNGDREYYHTNHQGSTIALTGDDGTVLEEFEYDAFGKSDDSVTGNPYRYTGRRLDEEIQKNNTCTNPRIHNLF